MNNSGTELLKTCELRSENAAQYFYSYVVYVNLLSSSRPQPLLHGDRKWWFRRASGVRHGKWPILVVKPQNLCVLKSLYFHRILTFICTLEVYSHEHVICKSANFWQPSCQSVTYTYLQDNANDVSCCTWYSWDFAG